jgi:CheY-like chemotaxis protein
MRFALRGSVAPAILVIDHDRNARLAIVELLTEEGYEATAVGDGEDALAVAREQAPDVILCDLRMPKQPDGGELYEALAALDRSRPLIVMSARHRGDTLGRFRHLGKPLEVPVLLSAVSTATSRGR